MQRETLKNYLEITTNAALLVAALLIISVFAAAYFVKTSPKPRPDVGFKVGQTFLPVTGVNYSDAPKILLIAMSTKCGYCAASMPFYKKLMDSQHPSTHIVGILPGTEQEIREFVQKQQLNIETKVADLRGLGLNATPTMILVDSHGQIQNFWIGKLSQESEAEVLKVTGNS